MPGRLKEWLGPWLIAYIQLVIVTKSVINQMIGRNYVFEIETGG